VAGVSRRGAGMTGTAAAALSLIPVTFPPAGASTPPVGNTGGSELLVNLALGDAERRG
jgi:hypothetical protein